MKIHSIMEGAASTAADKILRAAWAPAYNHLQGAVVAAARNKPNEAHTAATRASGALDVLRTLGADVANIQSLIRNGGDYKAAFGALNRERF